MTGRTVTCGDVDAPPSERTGDMTARSYSARLDWTATDIGQGGMTNLRM